MLIDGRRSECLPASDRGLQYGDGLFETVAVVCSRPALWSAHLDRLSRGCKRLGFAAPEPGLLSAEAEALCSEVSSGVLKIVVTRGSGGRGYRAPETPAPRRVLSIHPFPDYPARWWREGVQLHICRTRLGHQPVLAGIKHLNRLEQVLARSEWSDPAIAEGLMLSQNESVVEGTMSNLFAVVDGHVVTPALDNGGVAGVMRRHVMDRLESAGRRVEEIEMEMDTLNRAEELFLTNSVIGVWPVASVGDRDLPVGVLAQSLLKDLADEGVVAGPAGEARP